MLKLALEALLLFAGDQGIKYVVRQYPVRKTIWSVSGLLEVIRIQNTGAAFGILAGHPALFLGIGAMAVSAVCVIVALKYIQIDSPGERFMLALILGGALGNAADRLLMGSVTDYIRVRLFSFPVFNFADVCIVLGVCALSIRILRPDAPAMKEKRQNE